MRIVVSPDYQHLEDWGKQVPGLFATDSGELLYNGRNQVRLAYVLKKEDLNRALFVLRKALEAYPGRVE